MQKKLNLKIFESRDKFIKEHKQKFSTYRRCKCERFRSKKQKTQMFDLIVVKCDFTKNKILN